MFVRLTNGCQQNYNVIMKKEEFITKNYFEKTLDKRLSQQAQVIVAAVDGVLDKRLKEIKIDIKEIKIDISTIRQEAKQNKDELKKDINNVQILIDGYVKAQEEFKQEFIIMKEEMKQMKRVIKEKLGIEIRAI